MKLLPIGVKTKMTYCGNQMADKSDFAVVQNAPCTNLPLESAEEFKKWVLVDNLKPSVALRKLMDQYNTPNPDPNVAIELIELTYPELDAARLGFRFKVIDSAYPNSDPTQFSDEDFDKGIEELRSLPPEKW